MKLHDLKPDPGSRKKRTRVGRGISAGKGKTAGRGTKGAGARGQSARKGAYFEGGQLPLVRRLPFKRGFTNIFRIEYQEVNVAQLEALDAGTTVTPEMLAEKGWIRDADQAGRHPGRWRPEQEADRSARIASARARRRKSARRAAASKSCR